MQTTNNPASKPDTQTDNTTTTETTEVVVTVDALDGAQFEESEVQNDGAGSTASVEPNAEDPASATVINAGTEGAPAAGEELVLMIGDEVIAAADATTTAPETEVERTLRESNAKLQRDLDELKKKSEPAQPKDLVVPDLYAPGIEGDQDKYQTAMGEYYRELGKREAQLEQQQQAAEVERQAAEDNYRSNLNTYTQKIQTLKASNPSIDIEAADAALSKSLPVSHQAAIIAAGLDNPEMVVIALHRNAELRAKFAAEKNPIRLGKLLADLDSKVRLAPKAAAAPVNAEPEVKGATGASKADPFFNEFPGAIIE